MPPLTATLLSSVYESKLTDATPFSSRRDPSGRDPSRRDDGE